MIYRKKHETGQVFVRLPKKMIERLDKMANTWAMSRASFIKHILIEYLKEN